MKEKTPEQLAKLDETKLHSYFTKAARHLPQAKGGSREPYYVQIGTETLWAKTPKALFAKFKAAVKRLAKAPMKAQKADRDIICLLVLPISKSGVNLRDHLIPTDAKTGKRKKSPGMVAAMFRYAVDLDKAASNVRKVASALSGVKGVELNADATVIQFTGPESVLRPLVKSGLLWYDAAATKEMRRQ